MINRYSIFVLALIMFAYGCGIKNPSIFSHESPYHPINVLEKGKILHVPTGAFVSQDDLLSYITNTHIVYIGEFHDNLEHHKIQLDIIKALYNKFPGRVSVGMEMFSRPSQPVLDKWVDGKLDEKEFFKEWTKNWSGYYDYYRAILVYLRDNKIPLIALNADKKLVDSISQQGIENLPPELKSQLPDIDRSDPYHRAMTMAIFGDPRHGTKEVFEKFYEIQLLWEETMAETIANYLKSKEGKGRYMVVLTGGGHINYGFGIPKRVFRRLPEPYTTVLLNTAAHEVDKKTAREKGIKFLKVDLPSVPLYVADFVWATGYDTLKGKKPMLGIHFSDKDGKVTITGILPKSPAENGGLKTGDVIDGFDNEAVKDSSDLIYLIGLKKFGDTAVVSVLRDGEKKDFKVSFVKKQDGSEGLSEQTQP